MTAFNSQINPPSCLFCVAPLDNLLSSIPDRRSVSVNQDPPSTFSSAALLKGGGGDLPNGSSAAAASASDSFVGRGEGAFYLLA